MVRLSRVLVLSALLAMAAPRLAAAGTTRAVRFSNGTPAEALRARMLLAPLDWLLKSFRIHWRTPEPPPGSVPLRVDEGWVALEFPIREDARDLFLEVAGRVEFDHAEIVASDGNARLLDLHGASRGRGLYQLASFGGAESVEHVELVVRAHSDLAHVAVRIGR